MGWCCETGPFDVCDQAFALVRYAITFTLLAYFGKIVYVLEVNNEEDEFTVIVNKRHDLFAIDGDFFFWGFFNLFLIYLIGLTISKCGKHFISCAKACAHSFKRYLFSPCCDDDTTKKKRNRNIEEGKTSPSDDDYGDPTRSEDTPEDRSR